MRNTRLRSVAALLFLCLLPGFATGPRPAAQSLDTARRPMTFLDVQHLRTTGGHVPSPDGRWLLYTQSTMDWKEARRQTDIHVVSLPQGVSSARQLTFTKDKNETAPQWARDGSFFAFLSNRDAPENASTRNQLYAMRIDGGEARRVTYADGTTPSTLYAVPAIDAVANRSSWKPLTDANPHVREFALGAQDEITWTSKDGTMVGGVLVKPVGFQPGTRYPLIVATHGGPASADVLGFNGGTNSQVYAGAGYAVLRPNVKAVSEMAWMDYYVRGKGKKFAWRDVLATLDEGVPVKKGSN